uniref:Uncharacterized protein n=1 Tax=Ananas comosus var. bracteatus TaxID=296719 RepID=A0A6V7PL07_ANACO|nr:unnamed protein product [Ananas comosus var. bracteatus]
MTCGRVVDSVPTYGSHPENRSLKLGAKVSKVKMVGCSRVGFSGKCTGTASSLYRNRKCTGTQRIFLPTRASGLRAQWFVTVHLPVYRYTIQTAVWQFLKDLFVIVAIPYNPPHLLAGTFVLQQRRRRGESPLHFPWYFLSFVGIFGGLIFLFCSFLLVGDISIMREVLDLGEELVEGKIFNPS